MTTLAELITRTTARLSMVAGTGVQTYAEDRIGEMIQHKFDVLFEENFWPQFCTWAEWTLDGTLGVVTTDLTNLVKRVEDIQVIYRDGSVRPITKLKAGVTNPFLFSGTIPIHYDGLSDDNRFTRVFQIWPKTSTGTIAVHYRTKPDDFVGTDTVDFDAQALILGATYDYLEDDGTNPNATAKFENMFESRVDQLKSSFDDGVISLDDSNPPPNYSGYTEA